MERVKLVRFFQTQTQQIREGGLQVFLYKITAFFSILDKKLLARIYQLAVILNIDWADAYYFEGNKLRRKYYSARRNLNSSNELIDEIGNQAICCLKKAFSLKPERFEIYEILCELTHEMGDSSSFDMMHRITELQRKGAKAHQLDRLDIEFIPRAFAFGSIGPVFHLDAYIKAGILGLRSFKKPILLLNTNNTVTNPAYLKYWSRYLTIISDPFTVVCLSKIEKYLTVPLNWLLPFDEKTMFIQIAGGVVQKRWHEEGRPPLLTLTDEDHERGWQCLRSLGVPDDAWFVCLHVRESGWCDGRAVSEAFRNADINTYLPAIKTIVGAGGWVVRLGDPSMTPLPPMDHVIDYAHSKAKSDWMDVFLCASCRFCIGTSSGMHTIPTAFGVPIVMANCLPTVLSFSFPPQDTFIPRLCWSMKENRYFTFKELFSPPVSISISQYGYDRLGLKVIENSAEEINDLVTEMIARLDNTIEYTEEDRQLQERFQTLTADCGALHGSSEVAVNARIGRDFLYKYSSLLSDS